MGLFKRVSPSVTAYAVPPPSQREAWRAVGDADPYNPQPSAVLSREILHFVQNDRTTKEFVILREVKRPKYLSVFRSTASAKALFKTEASRREQAPALQDNGYGV